MFFCRREKVFCIHCVHCMPDISGFEDKESQNKWAKCARNFKTGQGNGHLYVVGKRLFDEEMLLCVSANQNGNCRKYEGKK